MNLRMGILKHFDSGNYHATVQMVSSYRVFLEGIAVARNLPEPEMINGRKVAVAFFDGHNTAEAVVVAVY